MPATSHPCSTGQRPVGNHAQHWTHPAAAQWQSWQSDLLMPSPESGDEALLAEVVGAGVHSLRSGLHCAPQSALRKKVCRALESRGKRAHRCQEQDLGPGPPHSLAHHVLDTLLDLKWSVIVWSGCRAYPRWCPCVAEHLGQHPGTCRRTCPGPRLGQGMEALVGWHLLSPLPGRAGQC